MIDVNKMTVNELREELKKRKLATGGVKATLAERLKSALTAEGVEMNNSTPTTSPAFDRAPSAVIFSSNCVL